MFLKAARIACCASLLVSTHIMIAPSAIAQDANARAAEFSSLLKQIENVTLEMAHQEARVATQEKQIESLQAQISNVPNANASIKDMALKMVAEIEKQIEQDIPFRKEKRAGDLGYLLGIKNDPGAPASQIYREALRVIETEAEYGAAISAYTGNHPTAPGRRLKACQEDISSSVCNLSKELSDKLKDGAVIDGTGSPDDVSDEVKDGNYVHFGRMSLAYLDLDSREGFRWSKSTSSWEPLNDTEILNVRRAIRVAKGESAPAVVTGPLQIEAAQ